MKTTADYICAFCCEADITFVDLGAENQQSHVKDCQVCCRPNILYLRVNQETLAVEIEIESEQK